MRMTRASALALLIAGLLGLAVSSSARAGSIVEGPIYDPYSKMNLYVLSPESWTQAETDAEKLGGHLVTIVSPDDNAFIVNNVLKDFSSSGGPNLSNLPLWIGLYDPVSGDGNGAQHAADFQWVDGSTDAYRNWNPGEPNNTYPGEYWGTINWHKAAGFTSTPGTWNDTPNDGTSTQYNVGDQNSNGPYYGIAEVPTSTPEPASLTLLGLGACGLLGHGWRKRKRACVIC